MRKLFLIFLPVALAAAVSCGKETVESKGGADIGFITHVTRAQGVDTSADVAGRGGFRVWGYVHSGNWPATVKRTIFNGTNVTSGDGGLTWSYSDVWAVWPARDNVSFFACAPAQIMGTTIDESEVVPVVEFIVDSDPASQQDLLIAQQVLDRQGAAPVGVAFGHALSHISFSAAKTPETTADINVTRIELRNVSYRGRASIMTPVAWTNYPDFTTYTLTTADGLLADTSPSISDSWQTISTAGGIMFLMPQTFGPTAEMAITFDYSSDLIQREFTSVTALSGITPEWSPATRYNYHLLFDGEEVLVVGATLEAVENENWGQF